MKQSVTILGATGSIGQSTLQVLSQHLDQYELYAVTAHSRILELVEICKQHCPKVVVIPSQHVSQFRLLVKQFNIVEPTILVGEEGLLEVSSAPDVDIVMAAIVGAAGLLPTLAAAKAGKRILLANKEALVMSGDIMLAQARDAGATILPVDSEHNAIFQCLPEQYFEHRQANQQPQLGVSQILLTASGGPFLNHTAEQLAHVTPQQACKHPNWSMGQKISIDSATLMNKGLELIEACHLFSISEQFVTVVIHPQSIIHSMVQYIDGSTLAQMGNPDMCTPIAHALAWPKRISTHVPALNLFDIQQLNFYPPDEVKFPALRLARQAMREGGTSPALLNAANEIAVSAFLDQKIKFTQIPQAVESALQAIPSVHASSLELILQADCQARQFTEDWIKQYGEQ